MPLTLVSHGTEAKLGTSVFASLKEKALNSASPNQPVHLTPKARAFFSLAISEQNVAFAKLSLAFGAGDSHVLLT